MRFAGFLLAALALPVLGAEVAGRWTAEFTGPILDRPKMVAVMTFDLKVSGGKILGTAEMGNWPGRADLIDGEIDGNRIAFTAVGSSPWRSKGPQGEASGLPKLRFTGTIQSHGELKLTLHWDNEMLYGNAPDVREYEMKGRKLPDRAIEPAGRISDRPR